MLFGLYLTHSAKVWYFWTLLLHCYGEADITEGSEGSKTKCCLLSNHDKLRHQHVSVWLTLSSTMSSEILAFQNTAMFCAIRRAGPSKFSYSKSNICLHNCDNLLNFQLSIIIMNVNGFKTERLQFIVEIFNHFTQYRVISSLNVH